MSLPRLDPAGHPARQRRDHRRRSRARRPRTASARSPTPTAAGCSTSTRAADPDRALGAGRAAASTGSGVCNRLNLLLIDEAPGTTCCPRCCRLLERLGIRACLPPHPHPLGHEWALDDGNEATVTLAPVAGPREAARLANAETSGLAAAIVTEDPAAAETFLAAYAGTGAFWNATTRLLDGFELLGAPETGHQRRSRARAPRPGDLPRPPPAPVRRRPAMTSAVSARRSRAAAIVSRPARTATTTLMTDTLPTTEPRRALDARAPAWRGIRLRPVTVLFAS